jgi:hypothetical protein
MKCEEGAEFVSALCDGEKIPRAAAEHVGTCKVCAMRLTEYAEMGAELRRVASLESTEPSPLTWGKQQRTKSNWWQKGWETMRIPRIAFALLVVAVLVMGSGLVLVKARAQAQGKVLMLRVKPENGQSMLCALTQDEPPGPYSDFPLCASILNLKSGLLIDGFRIISKNGDRVELGVRAGFTAFPVDARGGFSASLEDIRKLPESTYWLEPGEKLEVEVPGTGPLTVTGELTDHVPAVVTESNQLDPGPDELRAFSPVLLRNKKVILDFEGLLGTAATKKDGVFIYAPGEGRYILSLSPLEGAVQGHVTLSRVSFEENGQPYVFLMAAPISRSDTIWVLHQPNYRPSQDSFTNQDDKVMGGSWKLDSFLAKAPPRN